ncbi:GGDEF domain-containing protein [Motiliproteus sediminis]|uniref:GGDEF domain-containing protein n=1 Tax=Motiliproteus sediminis TaxID=1468178 RepID=UPI001AEF3E22|nr:GGDEF domain-containing protein [Motiliproteus sediminis]
MALDRQFDHQSSSRLISVLHRTALTAVCVVIIVAGLGIYATFSKFVVRAAETDAERVSQAFMALEQQHIVHPRHDGVEQLSVSSAEVDHLDTSLALLVRPFNIVKVKIFAADGLIVYSTEHALIGQRDGDNADLQRALRGYSVSALQNKDAVFDLNSEQRFDVDVVESYVPVRNARHEVLGAFEVYQDVTQYRAEVFKGVVTSLTVLVLILVAVFSSAYLVLRVALNRLSESQQELHRLATRDGLTGMLNRREVMRRAQEEIARYRRERLQDHGHSFVSLLMIDVDHFKRINDLHGHQAGDSVLIKVAQLIRNQLREYNEVGRYGGEEFLVLMPGTGPGQALKVAERIRQQVADYRFEHQRERFIVTLSLGVATVIGDEELEQVVRRADQSLYAAKERGRNRVETVDTELSGD